MSPVIEFNAMKYQYFEKKKNIFKTNALAIRKDHILAEARLIWRSRRAALYSRLDPQFGLTDKISFPLSFGTVIAQVLNGSSFFSPGDIWQYLHTFGY